MYEFVLSERFVVYNKLHAKGFFIAHEIHEIHEISHAQACAVGLAECMRPGGTRELTMRAFVCFVNFV